ncbi:MAG: hypothetical protein GVY07_10245 [Bacteroidetes bacterium]|jgi:hypothetical protein|nr:hypothetical protein [Bacteroidota bacterium]
MIDFLLRAISKNNELNFRKVGSLLENFTSYLEPTKAIDVQPTTMNAQKEAKIGGSAFTTLIRDL